MPLQKRMHQRESLQNTCGRTAKDTSGCKNISKTQKRRFKQDMQFLRYLSKENTNVLAESTFLAMACSNEQRFWMDFILKTAKGKLSLHENIFVKVTAPSLIFSSLLCNRNGFQVFIPTTGNGFKVSVPTIVSSFCISPCPCNKQPLLFHRHFPAISRTSSSSIFS